MKPEFKDGHVRANCPDCGAITTFEYMAQGNEFGGIVQQTLREFEKTMYQRTIYKLLRCAGCGRGGLAEVHDNAQRACWVACFRARSTPCRCLRLYLMASTGNFERQRFVVQLRLGAVGPRSCVPPWKKRFVRTATKREISQKESTRPQRTARLLRLDLSEPMMTFECWETTYCTTTGGR